MGNHADDVDDHAHVFTVPLQTRLPLSSISMSIYRQDCFCLLYLYRQDCPKTRLTNAEWHLLHRLTCTEPGKIQPTCCQTGKMQPDKWLHAYAVRLTECSLTSGYMHMQGGGSRGSWQCPWRSGNVPWQPKQHTTQPVLPKGFAYNDTFAHVHQSQHTHRTALHLHSLLQPMPCVAQDIRSCWVLVSSGACPMSCYYLSPGNVVFPSF